MNLKCFSFLLMLFIISLIGCRNESSKKINSNPIFATPTQGQNTYIYGVIVYPATTAIVDSIFQSTDPADYGFTYDGTYLKKTFGLSNVTVIIDDTLTASTDSLGLLSVYTQSENVCVSKNDSVYHFINTLQGETTIYSHNIPWNGMTCCIDTSQARKILRKGSKVCMDYNGPLGDGIHYPADTWKGFRNWIGSDCYYFTNICWNEYMDGWSCYRNHGNKICSDIFR